MQVHNKMHNKILSLYVPNKSLHIRSCHPIQSLNLLKKRLTLQTTLSMRSLPLQNLYMCKLPHVKIILTCRGDKENASSCKSYSISGVQLGVDHDFYYASHLYLNYVLIFLYFVQSSLSHHSLCQFLCLVFTNPNDLAIDHYLGSYDIPTLGVFVLDIFPMLLAQLLKFSLGRSLSVSGLASGSNSGRNTYSSDTKLT